MGKVCIELDDKIYSITNMLPRKKKRELFHLAIREFLSKEENLSNFFSNEIKEIVKKVLEIETKEESINEEENNSNSKDKNGNNLRENNSKTKSMW